MIKVENTDVWGFEHAIRGCRNPLNSWAKIDSDQCIMCEGCKAEEWCGGENRWNPGSFVIGPNDMKLMQTLIKSGSEHRQFMRQIMVSCDITAPFFWWKEAMTYRVGVTVNACSTMHKITSKPIEVSDFSWEFDVVNNEPDRYFVLCVESCENLRQKYLETKDKRYWRKLIQLLPSSYNQKRTWTGSYENLLSMYRQRKNHKLDEWHQFCDWIATLPYAKELIMIGDNDDSTHQQS